MITMEGMKDGKKIGRSNHKRADKPDEVCGRTERKSNSSKKKIESRIKKGDPRKFRNFGREPKCVWKVDINKMLQGWTYFALRLNGEFVANIILKHKEFDDFKRRVEGREDEIV